jgi:hypothetical protein
LVGQSGGVTRAVQDANNHKLVLVMHVIHSVVAGESDAEAWRELLARGACERKMPQWLTIARDLVDKAFRNRFGSFDGDIKPNLGKVGFGGVG